MNDLATWQETNDKYLADALAWLRERLGRLAEQMSPQPESTAETADPSKSPPNPLFDHDILLPVSDATSSDSVSPPPPPVDSEELGPPPALLLLASRFGLSAFETNVLLLCAAMEFDTRTAWLCARAQRDATKPYPTFALALTLFDCPAWDVMSPQRPLRYWRLIEINQPGAQPLATSALRADERIVNYLKGLNYLDDRLTPMLEPLTGTGDGLPPSQQKQADIIVQRLRNTIDELPVIHLLGPDSVSKQSIAKQAAKELGLSIYRLPADALPAAWPELETLARLYQRESQMLPIALYLDAHDSDKELPAVKPFPGQNVRPGFSDTRESWPQLGRDALTLDVAKPSAAEQEEAWQKALGEEAGPAPALLAGQFNLNLPEIQRIGHIVSSATDDKQPVADRAWDACLVTARPRMDTLAQRLEVRAQAWDGLVLPDVEKKLLRQIMRPGRPAPPGLRTLGIRRRMSRGLGISALFAGESGTGKTHGGRGARQRAAARPLPHRPLGGGQQVHRRDREEPAPAVRRGRGRRRDPVLRRGRRAVRQAQRGQGQPRPLRQHRGQLPAAAHGGLPRPGDPGDQHEERARSRPSCAACASSSTSRFPACPNASAIWRKAFPPRRRDRSPRLRPAGATQPDRRQHPQHRPQRRLPRGAAREAA